MDLLELKKQANQSRKITWDLIYKYESGHTGGDLSSADILTCLYFKIMNINKDNLNDSNRDRFVQSKGHCAEILWVTLQQKGIIDEESLYSYNRFQSPIIGHPINDVDGVEVNTGSLGHGLSIGVGMALAAKMDGSSYKTYVLLGDGELAEGSVWEAAMSAGHYKLDNLTAIVDRNKLQISGSTEDVMSIDPLADKWRAFGWDVLEIDGNDMEELIEAFNKNTSGKPKAIIANTIKGKGVSIAENKAVWHHKVPSEEEYILGLKELDEEYKELSDESND